MTDFTQKVNFKARPECEWAAHIRSLSEVEDARSKT
jgi:flagellar biosynthesis/type III secretory pathway M-ring protein FliF/YscJ